MAFFAEPLEARCQVENEDVVGAAPTGGASTKSEWSTILLPTNVRLILDQWNRKRIGYISIQENAFENVVLEMAAILA